jgi:hypothetical protein
VNANVNLFAVRMIVDQQPVGFFFVTNLGQLWDMVETITHPGECEYLEITNATAIIWESAETWRMGARDGPMAEASDDGVPDAIEDRLTQIKRGMSFDVDWEQSLMRFVDGEDEILGWTKIPRPW